jgi:hypothetical protein
VTEATGRGDRYGYWVPLVLLGFGLLGLLGVSLARPVPFWFAYTPMAETQILSVGQYTVSGVRYGEAVLWSDTWQYPPRGWSWAVVVLGTFVATAAWYGWRARRAVPWRRTVLFAGVGVVAIALLYLTVAVADTMPDRGELVSAVGVPMALFGAIAGAWWYFRSGPGRTVAAALALFAVFVGAGTVLGALAPALTDPVIIAVGLLGLARVERSLLLAGVAVASFVAMVTLPAGTLDTLIAALVLLVGGIAALVLRGRAATAPPAPGTMG